MRFISTRGQTAAVGFSEAVALGLAPDGGLFLPEQLPDLSQRWQAWEKLSYAELCFEFFKIFATDIEPAALREMTRRAYAGFDAPEIAPLRQLAPELHVLELFHGPTLAFKDFALQLLGLLYENQCLRTNTALNVLGATSGDTGAAAIHGLLGKAHAKIFILYPDGRVSPLQERQMACTGADNVFAIAIDGTFDDAQAIVKSIFGDQKFRDGKNLSAVNSINLARILAQCVYYLWAWNRLPKEQRAAAEFVVPTGNFGNVLAGWMLQKMGVPLASFRVATNQNDILYRLFTTGDYSVADVRPSYAPSMDIQVASNFERFLYFAEGRDSARVRSIMETFRKTGRYRFEQFNRDTFTASRTTDSEIAEIITETHKRYGYTVDPHTACGFKDLRSDRPSVILSTAHPAKFPDVIRSAIGAESTHKSLEALKTKTLAKHRLPASEEAIRRFIEQHAAR